MSLQQFVQSHCIVLQLRLTYKSVSAPNEALVHKAITSELQKFGNVLYSRSNAAVWQQTLKRSSPKIDLIMSSNQLHTLSYLLFNLRGFTVPTQKINLLPPDPLPTLKNFPQLVTVYKELRNRWTQNNHREKSRPRDLPPFVALDPWIFKSLPVNRIHTSKDSSMEINADSHFDIYEDRQVQGSRFFDFSRWQPPHDNGFIHTETEETDQFFDFAKTKLDSRRHIFVEPVLYPDYDCLPQEIKFWLEDIDEDSEDHGARWSKGQSQRLDFLLHGFKGFER
ncbi:LANO_0H20714g1_1 [Lachancea nothofagi CBS 11611]|uniref:LANO_0H20714g1_1 n=1 Tax=Lachancea nothofagi CBS 11611 TaxID=1266666 RepID=A0A1G4KNQ0_9SACH|nr:LANO_0H20714g1_1 [Lachancea nothofagi CBS 11611]